jgi:hypothetical protein
MPAIGVGIIWLPFLALTIFARYPSRLIGPVALDLRHRRRDLPLLQFVRVGRAVV